MGLRLPVMAGEKKEMWRESHTVLPASITTDLTRKEGTVDAERCSIEEKGGCTMRSRAMEREMGLSSAPAA